MNSFIVFLFALHLSYSCCSQTKQIIDSIKGKGFADKDLQYLKFMNDSVMQFSLERDSSIFILSNDTLCVKNDYWECCVNKVEKYIVKWDNYRILALTNDSIILCRKFKRFYDQVSEEDTLHFSSIDKLKKPVNDFRSLSLEMIAPFGGWWVIHVNAGGVITYKWQAFENPNDPNGKKEKKSYFGKLSRNELMHFKTVLAGSLYWRLPKERECSGMDQIHSTVIIHEKEKTFVSKGCSFNAVNGQLIGYLLELDNNTGFIR